MEILQITENPRDKNTIAIVKPGDKALIYSSRRGERTR
jgi:predicted RNA-binding protein